VNTTVISGLKYVNDILLLVRSRQVVQGTVMMESERVIVIVGGVIYCMAGAMVRLNKVVAYITGVVRVVVTDEGVVGVYMGLMVVTEFEDGLRERSVVVMVHCSELLYLKGLLIFLMTSYILPKHLKVIKGGVGLMTTSLILPARETRVVTIGEITISKGGVSVTLR